MPFSGRKVSVPQRLLLFGTMNPFDRSVSQVDAAFIRRFDHIHLSPSSEVVEQMLEQGGGFTAEQTAAIVDWFEATQQLLPLKLGHAFFKDVTDLDKLKLIWKYRILPTATAILELNPERTEDFHRSYEALIRRLEGCGHRGVDLLDVIEVIEHQQIDIAIERLISRGEFSLDARISHRGYLSVAITQGRLRLRSTRFVGLIPLNRDVAVRVKPAANIANLSQMIVRAGSVPTVIEHFARGYKPLFEQSAQAIDVHYVSFLAAIDRIVRRSILKRYTDVENPPNWRGRFLTARTINRYIARGIRYAAVFDFITLSQDIPENRIIKAALHDVVCWLLVHKSEPAYGRALVRARMLLAELSGVSELKGPTWRFTAEVPRLARLLPPHMQYYREALWSAYAILQRAIPDVVREGLVSLDSMIVDVSAVFENYVRLVISESTIHQGFIVKDGNRLPRPFFASNDTTYQVKPDIIIEKAGEVSAVFDVKYNPRSVNKIAMNCYHSWRPLACNMRRSFARKSLMEIHQSILVQRLAEKAWESSE